MNSHRGSSPNLRRRSAATSSLLRCSVCARTDAADNDGPASWSSTALTVEISQSAVPRSGHVFQAQRYPLDIEWDSTRNHRRTDLIALRAASETRTVTVGTPITELRHGNPHGLLANLAIRIPQRMEGNPNITILCRDSVSADLCDSAVRSNVATLHPRALASFKKSPLVP